MKKIYILLALVSGLAATSCQNKGWEDDVYTDYTIWNKSLQEHNVISVQELSAACPKVSQAHIEQLKTLGALGEMPDSNQINLFEM